MAVAAEVPERFDLVLSGVGYVLDRRQDVQAVHGNTPTFVTRQNVSGSYGDNTQEFWLVLSQNDWSQGEQQRYIRVNDAESRRRYWRGSAVDISREGEVALAPDTISYSTSTTVTASTNHQGIIAFVSGSTLFTVNHGGSISTVGTVTSTLSGLNAYGMCSDDRNVFIAYPSGGTNGCIRKWEGDSGPATFVDFAPSLGVTSVEFLNNTLFGLGQTSSGTPTLYSFSTSGTPTTIYQWSTGDGDPIAPANSGTLFSRLRRHGGALLILHTAHQGQLLEYTSDAPEVIAEFPHSFYATDLCVAQGIVFIGGAYYKRNTSNDEFYQRPAVFYYVDGRLDELWVADSFSTSSYAIGNTVPSANPVPFQRGVLWWDSIRAQLQFYDIKLGAVNGVSANTAVSGIGVAASAFAWFNGPSAGVAGQFPDTTSYASSGYVRTSLFDADSSLPKYWKSVKIDADIPSGASVDIAYRLNDLDGSYTTTQSSAVSGTEYTLGLSGRSISIQVTLNEGTNSTTPLLKRIYVRGVPILDTFERKQYVVDCSGVDAKNPVIRRDGTPETLTGLQLADNLRTAAEATSPFSVTDEFGSFTGLIEADSLRIERVRDRQYRASFTVRQV